MDRNRFTPAPAAVNPETPGFELPRITFGLEQEFNFAVKKTQFERYDTNDQTTLLSDTITRPKQLSSEATGSEAWAFQASHIKYIWYLLRHNHPHFSNYNTPCVICPISMGEVKKHAYDRFTLVVDDSVMPKWRAQAKGRWSIDAALCEMHEEEWDKVETMLREKLKQPFFNLDELFTEIENDYDRVGAELVSKVLDYEDRDHWMECLLQVQKDLAWDEKQGHGAFMDEDPHLHVHMSMPGDLPLRTVQNIMLLYGLFEDEIERWHPASQRENKFCWSLRKGTAFGPYTPHSYAEGIYGVQELGGSEPGERPTGLKSAVIDWDHIAMVSGLGIDDEYYYNWTQINLSLQRGDKPRTLEFRVHRGTLDAEEIRWWVLFVGSLVQFAHTLTQSDIKIANPVTPSNETGGHDAVLQFTQTSILEHLNFPEEGVAFFRAKENEYFDEHSERRSRFNSKVVADRICRRLANPNTFHSILEQQMQDQHWYI